MINIRKSLSLKLSLSILLLAVMIFVVSLGLLFNQSRYMIRKEAVGRANSVLNTTMQRVWLKLNAVETATNACGWLVTQNLHPDSLLQLSHRVVLLNAHVDGCSVSCEPGVFPEYGRYFSVYSIREGDSITTAIEEQYEYFVKNWYKNAHDAGKACWVDFYDETDSLELTLKGMIASYSKPLYNDNGRLVAIMSTDIELKRLSKVISEEEKPYPLSYFVMLDGEGNYIVHPDSTRLFSKSVFTGEDPRQHADLFSLGHEMTSGGEGSMTVDIDGVSCLVCYMPVPHTNWSLAVVCPENDILSGYQRLSYIVLPILFVGLFFILLLSHRTVAHAVRPLNQLLEKSQIIASGNMEVYIPRSQREDAVGRLQNSFASMLQRLNFHMGSVRYTTELARRRNEELVEATRLAMEAEKQKTLFIQNVTHQIRTPLNIVMGFAQILDAGQVLTKDELKSITDTLKHNAKLLTRLVSMLFDSSDMGLSEELGSNSIDRVSCNEVAHEAVGHILMYHPEFNIPFQSDVDDDFCIKTNHSYLMRSLREILFNSAKYSDGQHISVRISLGEEKTSIRFIVEDTGKGIDEADRELMFKFFTKVDDLSEGLGLGLPLSKRHAQTLGGDLTLDESYHDGCRFILELPII